MKIIDIQDAYTRKFERQSKVKRLQVHAAGHCAHVGKISPGCYGCFYPAASWGMRLGEDVGLPNVCNMNCVHCFDDRNSRRSYDVPRGWKMPQKHRDDILRYFIPYNRLKSLFVIYNFSGVSEPLFYLPVIRQYMDHFRNVIEKEILKVRGWAKIYTNGTLLDRDRILRLKDMGFNEVRVNPSASGFSSKVYRNIETAAKYLPVVTIEVPSWPPYRKKLFEMLPIIEDLGVRHLDICQVEIMNDAGLKRISRVLRGEIYQGYWMMLDDGGMVEDIMQEVINKKYSYSVIDCNAFVKQVNRNECMKKCFRDFCATDKLDDIFSGDKLGENSGWPAAAAGPACSDNKAR